MRILRIFWSEETFQAEVARQAEAIVRKEIAERIRLYSSNQEFIRRATAAFHGVDVRHVPVDSSLAVWVARAIRAFADALALSAATVEASDVPAIEDWRDALDDRRDEFPVGSAFSG